jgi:hypothetical protein
MLFDSFLDKSHASGPFAYISEPWVSNLNTFLNNQLGKLFWIEIL